MASMTMNNAGASTILGSSGAQSLANSMKINLYKLKYRIVYCSGKWRIFNTYIGEDSDYPVTELLDNSPQSRGW